MLFARIAFFLLSLPLLASPALAVIHGRSPDLRKYPVALRVVRVILPGSKCTGFLLTDRVVLTAAHCDNPRASLKAGFKPHSKAALQSLVSTSWIAGKALQGGKAMDAIVLQNYWQNAGRGIYGRENGDMMLLLLQEPASLPAGVTVKLADGSADETGPMWLHVFGVGLNDEGDPHPRQASFYQEPLYEPSSNGLDLDTFDLISPRGGSLCEGDSGGPVLKSEKDGSWKLMGVYYEMEYQRSWRERAFGLSPKSMREKCARARRYSSVTVAWHRQWIERAVSELYRRNGLDVGAAVIE